MAEKPVVSKLSDVERLTEALRVEALALRNLSAARKNVREAQRLLVAASQPELPGT